MQTVFPSNDISPGSEIYLSLWAPITQLIRFNQVLYSLQINVMEEKYYSRKGKDTKMLQEEQDTWIILVC